MEYLTVAEVAKRLRLHEMTVRRHIKSGRLHGVRAGRRIRVPEEELANFLKPEKSQSPMSPEELKTWLLRELTPEEREQRRKWVAGIEGLQRPIDINSATLVRVSRREDEVLYGDKTWKELIAEES
jgi:excisionase family DNA binding protein